ncbi:cytochrome Bd ubiquinol oxidase subunit I [Mycoavidus cysteinexigens]|uniref:Cytochrome Bd ubiquinol oxidase subunit I n=1 Tax=Mycoavidus cysteinexigens TaxID=1553431 RepID=A0A2Z6EYP5_9BURK|nr:cytochrome ubiquinol oxidase subunit I [Mycoavidus cysteinexigens]BBE10345.1 cytochrome Bd ubiquinol oxidase subunit I [Mycoavidus cysteinexigens]GAM53282.1 putative Cytochrome bd2, subunit I [bacterium endosymbiont of Mortierella elongata FMR23-6]GLR00762.1 cytochrome ubiquinol oxidase subunit I [Mycoavidus cysteinexigens]
MIALDALTLARVQFGFTVSFHIIFPALTIGLASYLAVLEGWWLHSRKQVYQDLYHFWLKIFAINFGMGVVSGLVMAYQFGTNWSYFSAFAGSVTGPLLTYEVLTAFFLEAGFLGVMMFGWNRVGPGLHFLSTIMVALGTLVSATWIIASNSWMHTPAGYEIVAGKVVPTDWLQVILNPSFPYRLAHMGVAAFLATALFVAAVAAWHLLRGRQQPAIRKMFSMALWMALLVAPLQALIGDFHGLNTLKHQPAKVAAIEGHWENHASPGMPLTLFGWPDMKREETRYALQIPRLGGLILAHSWDGQIPGLKEFAPADRPNATIVFWTFRIMVGLGVLMIALGVWGFYLRCRKRLYQSRAFMHFALWMGPTGIIAILAGWYTTEIGRQPWTVYGVMRTADAVSTHSALQLGISLVIFVLVYFAVFGAGIVYMMRLAQQGPILNEGKETNPGGPGQLHQPMRPLSAAPAVSKDKEQNTNPGN